MENIVVFFGVAWLACAFLAAAVVQSKLTGESALPALASGVEKPGTSARGTLAALASLGASAYGRIRVDRPMGNDQQTDHTPGGVRGPRYAWREPVTT
ncbi:hypothetical protein Pth03_54230 [Planotetraspora thailandica]|uniref:Uncharacterized protein n=1 Tax=Planotetraspora thailandica TaxID=487172 RepID=A0A8J3XXT5_9ACTN|nr:hypothetical protein [Planotetraspora thailandica]GII57034.1 hypothetical protein Pth03_54230 [Planotetraspora thailandica]